MINWITNNWDVLLVAGLAVIGAASAAAAAIAPLTKNTVDDKAASWLKKIHSVLSKIALNK